MKAVVQRALRAEVRVDGAVVGSIGKGLVVYLGVGKGDGEAEVAWLAEKIAGLRIFEDEGGKMNLSVVDVGGGALVISQFTLLADSRKGRRPSYADAAEPAIADALYEAFKLKLSSLVGQCASGVFGASMEVDYINMGPVTIILDTAER